MYEKKSSTFLRGCTLSWLTGTATTKDVNSIKTRINHLITTQQNQQETLVHIISILNITRYTTQGQQATHKYTNEHNGKDASGYATTQYNIMHSLIQQLKLTAIYTPHPIHLGKPLRQDSLYYMREVALHIMDYIDAATTVILSPHVLSVEDLREMLIIHINGNASFYHCTPTNFIQKIHYISTDYLCTHILIADEQFLLLIDQHTNTGSCTWQMEIYEVFKFRYTYTEISQHIMTCKTSTWA